jgi:hypothetical protein
MDAAALFDKKFESVEKVVEFNPGWNNGTGYYDGSVELMGDGEPEIAVSLRPGEMAKSISPNNRKLVFVGTPLGACVVFQRYSGSSDVLVTNQARFLASTGLIENGALSYDALQRIVGGEYIGEPNIGEFLLNIRRCFSLAEATDD